MGGPKVHDRTSLLSDNDTKMEKQNSRKSTATDAEQGGGGGGSHINFSSSSSFSNQNSEEFKPQFQSQGGHLELASSSSFSNYNHSGEFKPSRPSHHGHIELASSSSFSNYNSREFNPPKRRDRTRQDSENSSPASISSDRTVISHPSPVPKRPADTIPTPATKKPPEKQKLPDKPPATVSLPAKDQSAEPLKKTDGGSAADEGGAGGSGRFRPSPSILRRSRREQLVKKAAFVFRVIGAFVSFFSVAVMAANRNQGFAKDSFHHYKEFRYCIIVNLIACVYSGAQALHLGYQLVTGRCISLQHLRHCFDFSIDQMVSYVLISASSSAATRVDDWRSNWGNDKFPDLASASVSLSFLTFGALACSSLISGYSLCTSKPS